MNRRGQPSIVPGNRVTLLKNGADFFPSLIEAIDEASVEIRLETYIFRDDVAGINIAEALKRAAQRSVTVCLLIDGVGSKQTPQSFFEDMKQSGITVLVFRPERKGFNIQRSRLRRVHRKIALVDGRIGFVGGINLIDDATDSLSEFPRYDYAVKLEGPILAGIHLQMVKLWRAVSWWKFGRKLANSLATLPTASSPTMLAGMAPAGTVNAYFVVRDNFRNRRDIENAYLGAIRNARKDIVITSPYFLPGRSFRRALIAAALRGTKVTLLLQGRADHAMLQQATRALYTQLLGAGIAIFEYHRSMLHGKVAVVDTEWSTVGSSNLDPFSLFLNREANVVVIDEVFTGALRASVMEEIHLHASALDPADWQKRGWLDRTTSWLAYGFARWIMGWLGFAKRWD